MPIEHESLRLSCLLNKSEDIYDIIFYTLRNTKTSAGFCHISNHRCTGDSSSYEITTDKQGVHLDIRSLNKSRDEGQWMCRYKHHGKLFTAELNVTVYTAVTSVYINVSTSTVVFYERFSQSLTCTSSPSNPIPTITWWLDSVQMNDSIVVTNTRNVEGLYTTISQISLSFKRVDRNKVNYCDAYIGGQVPVSSRQLSVDVWYQPSIPNVTENGGANDKFPWFQNETGTMKCYSSDYGNPKSFVIWNGHIGVADKEGNLIMNALIPNDNGREVACKIENNFTIDKHLEVVSEPIKLNVECKYKSFFIPMKLK